MSGLLTPERAAEMLGISVRQTNNLARSRIFHAVFPEGRSIKAPRFYREDEVLAYLEIRDKRLDLAQLATIARQAYVASRQSERLLKRLMYFVGVDLPQISHKPEDVYSLYIRVEDALEDEGELKPEKIMQWARIFYAIGEEYLWLIEQIVEDVEPWKKLLDLSQKMSREAPRGEFAANKEVMTAYGFLESGRRNLRNVSFFYIRNRHGDQAASLAFPTSQGDIIERQINIAFPDQE